MHPIPDSVLGDLARKCSLPSLHAKDQVDAPVPFGAKPAVVHGGGPEVEPLNCEVSSAEIQLPKEENLDQETLQAKALRRV